MSKNSHFKTIGVLLISRALYWRIQYKESNPHIVMGPSEETMLDEILQDIPFQIDPHLRKIIIDSAVSGNCYK